MKRYESWSFSGIVLAATLTASSALATQPLDSFLERAKTQNFDSREAVATVKQRSAEADTALGKLTPAFSARGVYTRNQYEVAATLPTNGTAAPVRLVITPRDQLDAFLQLDVPIIDLANYHRYKAASAIAAAASEQTGATTIDVSKSVAQSYYKFIGSEALVTSAQESIKTAQANLQNVDNRRSAGAATDLDHERAAAAVAGAE
jgi:outer membrane protein TolC